MTDDDSHDSDAEASVDEESNDDEEHALPEEDLQYPEFVFDEGDVGERGEFDLHQSLTRDEMIDWLTDISGGLKSHDVAVESPDGHVRFGVGPKDVEMEFDPDEELRGELEITFRLNAKAMFVSDDPSKTKVGARGGKGLIPIEMLTTDQEVFRCYNWIDDPTDP
ncbi:hypothetical protein [Halorussus halophilus]|uniref:hypothetical protein n=1 Tax=Halorussus halophilus TaxID=2650975 RepID=UPI001301322A|nr:hypothetical protein [Halorussus halophilus]